LNANTLTEGSGEFKSLEKILDTHFQKKIFPSLEACALSDLNLVWSSKRPKKKAVSVYDIASLTKPLVTALGMAILQTRGRLRLMDSLGDFLPYVHESAKSVTLLECLLHRSGYGAHREWYIDLEKECGGIEAMEKVSIGDRKAWYQRKFRNEKLEYPNSTKTVYSDLGFWLLGWVIEEASGRSLDAFARKEIFQALNLRNTDYGVANLDLKVEPTEKNSRRGLIQGQVHDDNAWAMGGVAGHAGVFSTLEDITRFMKKVLKSLKGQESFLGIPYDTMDWMRSPYDRLGHRAPGWDLADVSGDSLAGSNVSSKTFGHLGFTGCSFWSDPVSEITMIVLSNRTYPSREDKGFKEFRKVFHTELAQVLKGGVNS
jgi:CubicO group peptidase (beta-lactamase class C family)